MHNLPNSFDPSNKYSRSIIYKITCSNKNLIYYGYTTTLLSSVISSHKSQYTKLKNSSSKKYIYSYLYLYDFQPVSYEVQMACSFSTKNELIEAYQLYINKNPCINKRTNFTFSDTHTPDGLMSIYDRVSHNNYSIPIKF